MNIPNLPTDNIYKFAAIFGLILFVGSILLRQSSNKKIHDTKIQSDLSLHRNQYDSVYLDFRLTMSKIKVESFRERMKTDLDSPSDVDKLLLDIDKMQEEDTEEFFKAHDKFSNSKNERYRNTKDLSFYEDEQERNHYLANTLKYIGIALIVFGFWRWYFKHQVYIDAEIKWKGETFVQLLKDANETSKSNEIKTETNPDD